MKKARLFMMLALALPMVAWGQKTYVLSVGDGLDVKYCSVSGGQPESDAQGRSWSEAEYDDSNWSSTRVFEANWNNVVPGADGFGNYFRVSFNLSEVKEDVNYYVPTIPENSCATFVSGVLVGDGWGTFQIPQSLLKVGENVLGVFDIDPFWCVDGVFYDTKKYDRNGTAYDWPIVETDVSVLANAIYLEPIQTRMEKDVSVQIKLKNANTVASYQFKINLPGGVDMIEATLDENRHDEHSMSINGGTIAVISGTGGELSDNDGAIINMKLHVGNPLNDTGTLPIKITNAVYAQPDGTRVGMPTVTIPLTILAPEKGDANNDEVVTVADVVAIVNNIVGKENDSFTKLGADMNKDGFIDIADAQLALNKVLKRNNSRQAPEEDLSDPE